MEDGEDGRPGPPAQKLATLGDAHALDNAVQEDQLAEDHRFRERVVLLKDAYNQVFNDVTVFARFFLAIKAASTYYKIMTTEIISKMIHFLALSTSQQQAGTMFFNLIVQ